MNKFVLYFLFFLFITTNCSADEWFTPFTKEEIIAQTAFTVLTIADWGQTRDIAKHPEEYTEVNPVLGKHPSVRRVDIYIPAGIVAHGLVSWALPHKYRKYWQYVWIGVEFECVYSNYTSGIRIDF